MRISEEKSNDFILEDVILNEDRTTEQERRAIHEGNEISLSY